MGSPKKVPSMLNVEIVKLCSPLNQRVISLGLFPIASANCFFVIHFFCMSSSKRFEIWKESRASALSSGVMLRSSLNDVFALFITQIFHQSGYYFKKVKVRNIFHIYVKCCDYLMFLILRISK